MWSATQPASAGPISPGTTQAVERYANIWPRIDSGKVRPIATYATGAIAPAPKPCTARAVTRTPIAGESPPTVRPIANRISPTTNGRAGPSASI